MIIARVTYKHINTYKHIEKACINEVNIKSRSIKQHKRLIERKESSIEIKTIVNLNRFSMWQIGLVVSAVPRRILNFTISLFGKQRM